MEKWNSGRVEKWKSGMVEKWKRWDLFLVAAVAGLGSVRAEPQFTLTLRTSPDGEEAVVLANATWSGQKVEMTWNGRDKSVVVGAGDIVVVGWPTMHGL